MASAAPITVGYWGIRGLGAPLRMMVMYTSTPLRCEVYDIVKKPDGGWDASSWFSKKPELKAKNPLINLPYVLDGDVLITQTNACMAYVGRKLGLWGSTEGEVIQCEQLLCELMDLRNKMTTFAYSGVSPAEIGAAAGKLLKDVGGPNGILQKLELWLEANKAGDGCFFVSDHATAPDFHCLELLEQYTAMSKYFEHGDLLASFPRLAAFMTKFAALPGNARYLASPLHTKLPFNNKMAVYGATPSGAVLSPDQEIDWHGLAGMY